MNDNFIDRFDCNGIQLTLGDVVKFYNGYNPFVMSMGTVHSAFLDGAIEIQTENDGIIRYAHTVYRVSEDEALIYRLSI